MDERGLESALSKMQAAGLSDAARASFSRAWRQAASGAAGLIPEPEILPADGVPDFSEVAAADADPSLLGKLCVIKLNGGLGTSMGLEKAKSLIPVKDGLTFLDLIASQIVWLRNHHGTSGPRFLLMDSFSTSADTLAYMSRYPSLSPDGQLDFLQNKIPKLCAHTLAPAEWPADPGLEWCPPGHGDLYPSLLGSGWLDRLEREGVEYLFVSNSDNLGATVDLGLLGYFARSGLSFLMEVASRTSSDRKGGHLTRRKSDGRLILREVAQCPPQDTASFQDIAKHRFFNTNTLWFRVGDLCAALEKHGGALPLPLIKNTKTVDPRDSSSPPVLQLETAMGAAIECFEKSGAVLVPRTRFAPVKTTGDLLALRSDAYRLTDDFRLELSPECRGVPPEVVLDAGHYKVLSGLDRAFDRGAPSLRGCRRFEVTGPWKFGEAIVCQGDVRFVNASPQIATARAGNYRDAVVNP
ncbi:MAG: UTP--glucose-1-phosphate uridylyltransferase [Chthoniobacterales bacterium]|nr:UTP--glucose-1-phosphate uridylyltransferase [Chthoniobacterales bacterium]